MNLSYRRATIKTERRCGAVLARDHGPRTSNLVTVSPAWLTGGRHRVKAIAREASVALKQQRALTFALRGDLLLNVGGVLLRTALLEGYRFREGARHPPREDRDLRAAWSGTRRMIGREYEGMGQPTPTPSSVPLSGCAERRRLPAADYACGGGTCWVGWFVALRQSETLIVAPRARGTMRLYKHNCVRGGGVKRLRRSWAPRARQPSMSSKSASAAMYGT